MKKSELNNLIRERSELGIDRLLFRATEVQKKQMKAVVRELVKDIVEKADQVDRPADPRIERLITVERQILALQTERDNLIKEL
jgi:hypothetical protein